MVEQPTSLPESVRSCLFGAARRFDEAQTKQFLIFPMLSELGWNVFDNAEVWPEYRVRSMKFDIALRKHNQVQVVIEAKRLGSDLSSHRKQLLEYAFEGGVPVAILTDGKLWWVYLSLLAQTWQSRFVEAINLTKPDAAARLAAILSKAQVFSGKAFAELERTKHCRETTFELKTALPALIENLPADKDSFNAVVAYVARELRMPPSSVSEEVRTFFANLSKASSQTPISDTEPARQDQRNHPPSTSQSKSLPDDAFLPAVELRLFRRKLLFRETSQTAVAAAVLISLAIFAPDALRFSKRLHKALQLYYAEQPTTLGELIHSNQVKSYRTVKDPSVKVSWSPRSRYRATTIEQLVRDIEEATAKT